MAAQGALTGGPEGSVDVEDQEGMGLAHPVPAPTGFLPHVQAGDSIYPAHNMLLLEPGGVGLWRPAQAVRPGTEARAF